MENSDFPTQVALSTLLLQQRFATPLVTSQAADISRLRRECYVEALSFVEVRLLKQVVVTSLAEDVKLPRMAFISNRKVKESSHAQLASSLLGCEFVSKYQGKEIQSFTPVVEVGVGFVKPDNKPCIALHVLGPYDQLLDFLYAIDAAIILELEPIGDSASQIPEKFQKVEPFVQWEFSTKESKSKKAKKVMGTENQIQEFLSTFATKFIDKSCDGHRKSLREVCISHFPSNLPLISGVDQLEFDWENIRHHLLLQKFFENESRLQFEIQGLLNDPEKKKSKERRWLAAKAKRILEFPILQVLGMFF